MKPFRGTTLSIILLSMLLCGCSMVSLNPFFTAEHQTDEPALAGSWKDGRTSIVIEALDTLKLDVAGWKDEHWASMKTCFGGLDRTRGLYRITRREDNGDPVDYIGMLGQIGEHRFLQVTTMPDRGEGDLARAWHSLRLFTIWRVHVHADHVDLLGLEPRVFLAMRQAGRIHLEIARMEPCRSALDYYSLGMGVQMHAPLVASTADLTQFLLDHGSDKNLFHMSGETMVSSITLVSADVRD